MSKLTDNYITKEDIFNKIISNAVIVYKRYMMDYLSCSYYDEDDENNKIELRLVNEDEYEDFCIGLLDKKGANELVKEYPQIKRFVVINNEYKFDYDDFVKNYKSL